jgi:heme A synthase
VPQLTDWTKWEFYHYLIAAGVVVIVLALILYFIPGFRIKMPAIVIAALGSLAAGLGGRHALSASWDGAMLLWRLP